MQYYKEAVNVKEGERAWVTYIKAKVTEQNQSFPTLVVGQTGTGKSWSTLRLCQEINPDFTLDGNWYFRALDFYKDYNKYYKDKEGKQKGKIWVLDEAGVDFSSDDWQNKLNKIFAKLFSTARFRNYIFFGTVPFADFISKKIRKLMQYRFTANYTEKIGNKVRGIIVPRCLQWSDSKDDFYYHKLVKIEKDGEETDINRILMPKPKKHLLIEYEKRREEFSDNLDEELLNELDEKIEPKKPLDPQHQKIVDMIKEGNSHINIAKELDITVTAVAQKIKKLREIGWDFKIKKKVSYIFNPSTKKWEQYDLDKNMGCKVSET